MSELNHPPSPDPSRPVERRAWVRYPCAGDTSCLPIVAAPDSQWPGQVVDLSAGGVGVLLPRRFETGTVLSIEVQEKEGEGTRHLIGRVVRVTRGPDNRWLLGCTFVRPLTEDDVQALL